MIAARRVFATVLLAAAIGALTLGIPAFSQPAPIDRTAQSAASRPSLKSNRDVLRYLDVTSFLSSIGPRRQPDKVTFYDYGFRLVKVTGDAAGMKNSFILQPPDKSWKITLRVLDDATGTGGSEVITVCVHDQVMNGGSYNAQQKLELHWDSDGKHLIAS